MMKNKDMNLPHNSVNLDTYESFISEECFECGNELTRTEDIFVSVETDRYYCKHCADTYDIPVVPCVDWNLD